MPACTAPVPRSAGHRPTLEFPCKIGDRQLRLSGAADLLSAESCRNVCGGKGRSLRCRSRIAGVAQPGRVGRRCDDCGVTVAHQTSVTGREWRALILCVVIDGRHRTGVALDWSHRRRLRWSPARYARSAWRLHSRDQGSWRTIMAPVKRDGRRATSPSMYGRAHGQSGEPTFCRIASAMRQAARAPSGGTRRIHEVLRVRPAKGSSAGSRRR